MGCILWLRLLLHFYPRSPCGERPSDKVLRKAAKEFLSTLSLRRATGNVVAGLRTSKFLSTLSLRRATISPHSAPDTGRISIHALLAESDTTWSRPQRED